MEKELDKIIKHANEYNKIDDNPFFKYLDSQTPLSLLISLESFGEAVDSWSRLFGLLLAKVPSYKERSVILKNLVDENSELPHVVSYEMFIELVKSLCDKDKVNVTYKEKIQCKSHVAQFIERLYKIVYEYDWIIVTSAFAMIEYTYVDVSNYIHQYMKKRVVSDQIPHYSVHESLDVTHAYDLFGLLVPYQDENEHKIIAGIQLGYIILSEFYENLATTCEYSKINEEPLS